jgi:glycerol-1-phosphatase
VTDLGLALASCDQAPAQVYDAALLDLDGVLYLGSEGVPHAAEAVVAAGAAGMRLAYVTNNASRAPERVAEHLVELGIPARPEDVVNSGQAAARLVAERVSAGSPVLVVGSEALADQVAAAGLHPVRTVAEAGDDGPAAVLQGLSPETTWRDLGEAAVAVRSGALWVAGNVDSTLPTPRGPLPGNGTMVDAVRAATGAEPVVAGKPEPALHDESVRRVEARRPLVVGDRLDTDVLGAVRTGTDSLLVLTGVADLTALLGAPAGSRPAYVAADLRALHLPHPPVEVDDDEARCDGAVVRLDAEGLLHPSASRPGDVAGALAVLRAECALAWAAADRGVDVVGLASAAPDTDGGDVTQGR